MVSHFLITLAAPLALLYHLYYGTPSPVSLSPRTFLYAQLPQPQPPLSTAPPPRRRLFDDFGKFNDWLANCPPFLKLRMLNSVQRIALSHCLVIRGGHFLGRALSMLNFALLLTLCRPAFVILWFIAPIIINMLGSKANPDFL